MFALAVHRTCGQTTTPQRQDNFVLKEVLLVCLRAFPAWLSLHRLASKVSRISFNYGAGRTPNRYTFGSESQTKTETNAESEAEVTWRSVVQLAIWHWQTPGLANTEKLSGVNGSMRVRIEPVSTYNLFGAAVPMGMRITVSKEISTDKYILAAQPPQPRELAPPEEGTACLQILSRAARHEARVTRLAVGIETPSRKHCARTLCHSGPPPPRTGHLDIHGDGVGDSADPEPPT